MPLQIESVRFLSLLIASILPNVVSAAGAGPNLEDCSEHYDYERRSIIHRNDLMATVREASNKVSGAEVVIKSFATWDLFSLEANAFNLLSSSQTRYEQKHGRDSSWIHFVRPLLTCQVYGKPALVFEFLDDMLSNAIRETGASRRFDSYLVKSTLVAAPRQVASGFAQTTAAAAPNQMATRTGHEDAAALSQVATGSGQAASNQVAAGFAQVALGIVGAAGIPRPQLPSSLTKAAEFRMYAFELLRAVVIMHNVDIVHLDLKPDNIGLTSEGVLKLFDFHTARAATDIPNGYVGTLEYSAPEMNVIREIPIVNTKSADMWSVGCTIYEIFSGETLFWGITTFAEINQTPGAVQDRCFFAAAYVYIVWSLGGAHQRAQNYREMETPVLEACPQILISNQSKAMLRDRLNVLPLKLDAFRTDRQLITTRLHPSATPVAVNPGLVHLLTDLLRFDAGHRLSAYQALNQNIIFNEYRRRRKQINEYVFERM